MSRLIGVSAFAAFVATVWLANYAVDRWGVVPVGFGLSAPAAVYVVGLAFTLRDIIHRTLGRVAVVAAIIVAAVLSYLIAAGGTIPGGLVPIAAASAVALLLSESADLAVYEPLRRRGWMPAVVASNIAGTFVDSMLFLTLAFGSLTFLWGQVVGKLTMTAFAVAALGLIEIAGRERVPA